MAVAAYRELVTTLLPVTTFAGAFTLNAYFTIKCPLSLTATCLHASSILFLICPLGLILIQLLLGDYTTNETDDRNIKVSSIKGCQRQNLAKAIKSQI
jgi:hypothetical protein